MYSNMVSRELFGTDGVRGQAGQYPLDDATIRQIGLAIAAQFGQPARSILLGRDPRQSSPHIAQVLAESIVAGGADVKIVGVITTPGLAYLTRQTVASTGVMITASHNPYTDNGIKVFTAKGEKLTDEQEVTLNTTIGQAEPSTQPGRATEAEKLLKEYENFLVASAGGLNLTGMSLAIDSANGSASGIAKRVFKRLSANVTALFDKPDGININDGCGATNLAALKAEVSRRSLAAGVALDGDADRLMLIDEQGREVNGDHILYILAVTGKHKGVVTTVMSNYGFESALTDKGIKLQRTAVGDRYVMDGLRQTGYRLGGEQSGHIILPQLLSTGDGLLAAVQTLAAVKSSGKSLAAWRDELIMLPQAIVNLKVTDKSAINNPKIKTLIDQAVTDMAGQGRILVRPSGTEPLLRIMAEGDAAEQVAQQLADKIDQVIKQL